MALSRRQRRDCDTTDPLHDEANWRRATDTHEDQVEVEIYSDEQGAFPADRWRWGAGTTDPATPVAFTEFPAADPAELVGGNQHPTGGWSEDLFNTGSGWVRDAGRVTYEPNFLPGAKPIRIASKGTRDTRAQSRQAHGRPDLEIRLEGDRAV